MLCHGGFRQHLELLLGQFCRKAFAVSLVLGVRRDLVSSLGKLIRRRQLAGRQFGAPHRGLGARDLIDGRIVVEIFEQVTRRVLDDGPGRIAEVRPHRQVFFCPLRKPRGLARFTGNPHPQINGQLAADGFRLSPGKACLGADAPHLHATASVPPRLPVIAIALELYIYIRHGGQCSRAGFLSSSRRTGGVH